MAVSVGSGVTVAVGIIVGVGVGWGWPTPPRMTSTWSSAQVGQRIGVGLLLQQHVIRDDVVNLPDDQAPWHQLAARRLQQVALAQIGVLRQVLYAQAASRPAPVGDSVGAGAVHVDGDRAVHVGDQQHLGLVRPGHGADFADEIAARVGDGLAGNHAVRRPLVNDQDLVQAAGVAAEHHRALAAQIGELALEVQLAAQVGVLAFQLPQA